MKKERSGAEVSAGSESAVEMKAEELDPELVALERELSAALQPVELPVGFADRVLARAAGGEVPAVASVPVLLVAAAPRRGVVLPWPLQPRWMSGAAAAALVVALLGGGVVHEHQVQRERRVATANAQFATAQRITDQALEQARTQIVRAGVHLEP